MKLTKEQVKLLAITGVAWIAALVYLVFPVDLVPDFIPFLGQVDDLLALFMAGGMSLHTWSKLRQPAIEDHLPDGMQLLGDEDPAAYGWQAYEPISADEIRTL